MQTQTTITIEGNSLYVAGPYSGSNNAIYRKLGGAWDKSRNAWRVSAARKPEIARLFGSSEECVLARVPYAKVQTAEGEEYIGGYVLASRSGRDRPAQLFADLVAGTIPNYGGSAKHPAVNSSSDAEYTVIVRRDFAERKGLVIEESEEPTQPATEPDNPLAEIPTDRLLAELSRRNVSLERTI